MTCKWYTFPRHFVILNKSWLCFGNDIIQQRHIYLEKLFAVELHCNPKLCSCLRKLKTQKRWYSCFRVWRLRHRFFVGFPMWLWHGSAYLKENRGKELTATYSSNLNFSRYFLYIYFKNHADSIAYILLLSYTWRYFYCCFSNFSRFWKIRRWETTSLGE